MDLHAWFHQIRLHPANVERTAFKTKYGTYQYRVMPFGLCNAPATFQRTMDFVLNDLREFCGAYMDDILVYTGTLEDHLVALRAVFARGWIIKSSLLIPKSVSSRRLKSSIAGL